MIKLSNTIPFEVVMSICHCDWRRYRIMVKRVRKLNQYSTEVYVTLCSWYCSQNTLHNENVLKECAENVGICIQKYRFYTYQVPIYSWGKLHSQANPTQSLFAWIFCLCSCFVSFFFATNANKSIENLLDKSSFQNLALRSRHERYLLGHSVHTV